MLLAKKEAIYERDEQGELIPHEVTLELLDGSPTVYVTVLLHGEILRLGSLKSIYSKLENGENLSDIELNKLIDFQDETIMIHCKDPIFTKEELKYMKLKHKIAIYTAIISETTGLGQKEVGKDFKSIEDKTDELKKN